MNPTVKEFELVDASKRRGAGFFKFFPFSFPVLVCLTVSQSLSKELKQHLNIQKSQE